ALDNRHSTARNLRPVPHRQCLCPGGGIVAVTDPDLKSQPTGEVVRRLIDDVQALLDKQTQLVKQELREDLQQVLGAARSLGIGAGLLILAVICLFNFLFLAIDTFLPRWGWAAALVFTLVFAIVGTVLAIRSKD